MTGEGDFVIVIPGSPSEFYLSPGEGITRFLDEAHKYDSKDAEKNRKKTAKIVPISEILSGDYGKLKLSLVVEEDAF